MKKISFLIIIVFLIQTKVSSQSCLPDGITFNSQAEIDSFQVNYPNCSDIEGSVTISGDDITNLVGLNSLNSIGGGLTIEQNPILSNLTGLDNLESINMSLVLDENESLTTLTGLNSLTYIGGLLVLNENSMLSSIAMLNKVTFIGGQITVWNNEALLNFTGLENITTISGSVDIVGNSSLLSLSGFNNLAFISHYLRIKENFSLIDITNLDNLISVGALNIGSNPMLTSLVGLESLASIGDYLQIYQNNSIINLVGLESLTSIGQALRITYNSSLVSLAGIDNIFAASIQDLAIFENTSLSVCEVKSICDYLINPNGYLYIENNANGCNSIEEVNVACETAWVPNEQTELDLTIYPNPAKNKIFTSNKKNISLDEITIYNKFGQKIFQSETITNPIDISMIGSGLYIIEFATDQQRIRKVLIIK
ncbi:MAG: T9SS type A sorting domain-containing protein [Bacteroidota bacterium]